MRLWETTLKINLKRHIHTKYTHTSQAEITKRYGNKQQRQGNFLGVISHAQKNVEIVSINISMNLESLRITSRTSFRSIKVILFIASKHEHSKLMGIQSQAFPMSSKL